MFDIVIKGGTVVDGTGAAPSVQDVAIKDGVIAAIGPAIDGDAREVVDAAGKIVTPGFIDIHTHYDGQATWDDKMLPSSGHGVTTIVTGNCGVGFAPVRKGSEDWLITLTEGVEDIPGSALNVGIPWGWESFPEYLDFLDSRRYAVNIAAQVPHSAVRAYVLGQRQEDDAPATDAELAEITGIVSDAIRAGAVGMGTSRVTMHRGSDGSTVPGTRAPREELMAIAKAIRDAGGGVLQIIPSGVAGGVEGEEGEQTLAGLKDLRDQYPLTTEVEMMRWLNKETGVPITFSFAEAPGLGEEAYDRVCAMVADARAAGEEIYPQFSPRAIGGILSLDGYHIFTARPTYRAIVDLPRAERARKMADPAVKQAILSESDVDPGTDDPMQHIHKTFQRGLGWIYSLEPLDYEPDDSTSVKALADAAGRNPEDVFYDILIADEGRGSLIWMSTGYEDGDLRKKEACISNPDFIMGLGDGGAHVMFICDAGFPTFLLSYWGKDRTRGRRFPIEQLVRRLTKQPADLYRLQDRGVIAEGARADINVIDFDRLGLTHPRMVADLPTGATRYIQEARGYTMTIVNGEVTRRDDQDTGARPGRLIRNRNRALITSASLAGASR